MRISFTCLLACMALSACTHVEPQMPSAHPRLTQLDIPAPQAAEKPFTATYHGMTLSDPYNWIRDPDYPDVNDQEVLGYLKAENDYFDAFLKPHQKLVDTLVEEFKGRTDETEESVPWQHHGYEYRWYYKEGEEYQTHSRKNLATGEETIFLDESKLAQGHDYFDLLSWDISPDGKYLAYSLNTSGDERYTVHIVDLKTGAPVDLPLENVQGDVAFGGDSQTLIYGLLDKEKWFVRSINLHKIGSSQAQDIVLYTERDESFYLGFQITSSKQFLVLNSAKSDVNETYVVPMKDLRSKPMLLASREENFSYSVDHGNGFFYILANDEHINFRLAKVADSQPQYEHWQTIIAGSNALYQRQIQTFEQFYVLEVRENGLDQINVFDYQGNGYSVDFPEQVKTVRMGKNVEFSQGFVRLDYESMITPSTVLDFDVSSKTLTTRKVQNIPSGYDKSNYVTKRIMAQARDGVSIPITLVYRKDFRQDGRAPLMLEGYGAYGLTYDPEFDAMRLSLLDRGFAFAIAHARGSDMMGYQWYLDGKLDKRTNTFNDFVDVAKHLINENYVAAGNISISGRSAGGELMGAAVIQAPDLWRSVTLGVPFVDVLNTMLDASLPLTPPEWAEWGNPIEDPAVYDLLLSYSPYDNIEKREYPPMLITGGLNDPRVTYWEPAKFAAKMRNYKTDNNLLVMRINMGAGHFANSGRYGRQMDYAEEFAFVLLAHDITQ